MFLKKKNVHTLMKRGCRQIVRCYPNGEIWITKTRYLNGTKFRWLIHTYIHTYMQLTVCCYHATYALQSESTHYSCLNVTRNRRDIWRLSDSNGIQTDNYLIYKQTLNHLVKLASLTKWLSVRLQTKWMCVRILLLSLKL